MSYSKASGKPFEYASKISHRHFIADEEVQDYIKNCEIPFEGKDVELNASLKHCIDFPTQNRIENIIAIDGGYQTVTVKKKFPSSLLTYFQFGSLLLERKHLENLQIKPFISPKDMAELKKLTPDKLVLPTKNLLLKGQINLTYAVRKAIYDFFKKKDEGPKSLLNTLYWFLFKKYDTNCITINSCNCNDDSYIKPDENDSNHLHECQRCKTKAYQLSKCPQCEEPRVLLREDRLDHINYTWKCPYCQHEIFITDVFRIFETVDNEIGAGGALGYVITAVENLLVVHIIKMLIEYKIGLINNFLIIRDGPLSFIGQTANMHKPMRAMLNYLSNTNRINLVGIEKSGAFVDHAKEIKDKLEPGQLYLLDNDHIYKYILPGNEGSEYAKTSYYSGKVIYKSKEEKLYVLTIPVDRNTYYSKPELVDLKNIEEILMNIDLLKCDIYQDALIPIALVNKLISLSNYPSSNILEHFTKNSMTK